MPRAPVVETSSAPRSLEAVAASRSDDFRRRREKKNSNSNSSGGSGAGSARTTGDTSTPTRRRQEQEEQRAAASSAAGENSGSASSTRRNTTSPEDSSLRNPMSRYVLLSGVLVASGLAVRYLWRELAGLAGAVLILSTARHWSGDDGSDEGEVSPRGAVPPGGRGKGKETRTQGRKSWAPSEGRETGVDEGRSSGVGVGDATAEGGDGAGRGVTGFADAPAELRRYWEDGGPGCQFLVRGPKYLSDRKKVPARPAAMRLVHVDFFSVEKEVFHVASKGRCRDRVAGFLKEFEDRGETAPFLFILNILVPGNPIVATVMYLALDTTEQAESGGGGGEGGGTNSSNDTFFRMLERYAEVPGSGYKKLERTRFASPPPTPPPLPVPADSASLTAASIPSSFASSVPLPSAASSATPPPPPPPPPRQEQQPQRGEAPASPNLSQMLRSGAESSLAPALESSPRSENNSRNGGGGGSGGGDFIAGREVGVNDAPEAVAGSPPPIRESPMGSNASGSSSRGDNSNNNNNNGSGPAATLPGRFNDPVGLLPADDFRNQRFKLIPSVVSGPFIVRKAVGNKPALLGRKVSQRYFRGPGYVETDVDVGSSMIAEKIVSLCRGYAKSLTVELGICLEGRCDEELPEKVIGVIRLVNLDVDKAEPLLDADSDNSGLDRSSSSAECSSDRPLSSSSGKSPPRTSGQQGAGGALREKASPRTGGDHQSADRRRR